MMPQRKILITGTHLTPALELIRQLQVDRLIDWKIFYIGRKYNSTQNQQESIESQIIPQKNIPFFAISAGKFDRRWLPNTLQGLPQIIKAFSESYQLLKKINPRLVVSFGGYVSVPVVICAYLQKIPVISHEQTPTLSLSTRINSHFSKIVALSFPIKSSSSKYVLTGNLLRQDIFCKKSPLFEKLKLDYQHYPILFFTAGNQGSHHLNQTLKRILPTLTKKYTIIHQCGQRDYPIFQKYSSKFSRYYPFSYIDSADIGWVFHYSQIIISRSGANTTQEIAALQKKNILIPLAVSQQNEQLKNAHYLQHQIPQITFVIKDQELSSKNLFIAIEELANIKYKNKSLSPKNNLKLLKLIKRL